MVVILVMPMSEDYIPKVRVDWQYSKLLESFTVIKLEVKHYRVVDLGLLVEMLILII